MEIKAHQKKTYTPLILYRLLSDFFINCRSNNKNNNSNKFVQSNKNKTESIVFVPYRYCNKSINNIKIKQFRVISGDCALLSFKKTNCTILAKIKVKKNILNQN